MTADPRPKPQTRLDKLRAAVEQAEKARGAVAMVPHPDAEQPTYAQADADLQMVGRWLGAELRAEELRRAGK